jgi:hypothetical protein
MQNFILTAKLCALLIIVGCSPAFSQMNNDQNISSVTDDKINQLNNALTRIIDRQEDLKSNLTGIEETLTLFNEQNEMQNKDISTNLLGEIEALKIKNSNDIASINESLAAINVLSAAIDDLRAANETNKVESENAIESLESDLALLLEDKRRRDWLNKFEVLKDNKGFAELLSVGDLKRIAVTLPDEDSCSEMGGWLTQNVPMRDVNRFFVTVDNEFATCKLINDTWSAVPVSGGQKSHIVYVKN